MPDTYAIGSIPPISAWEGQTATFTITGSAGPGTKFSIRPSRSPKGKIEINEKTGVFSYTPTSDDREDFTVVFRAGQTDQTVSVAPQPRLPSDFNIIEHVSNPPVKTAPVKGIWDGDKEVVRVGGRNQSSPSQR